LRYVMIVAVTKYKFMDLGYGDNGTLDLAGVKIDADRLLWTLRAHTELLGGMIEFPASPLGPLTDDKATWENIRSAIEDLIHVVKPDDQVVLYFGGHGHFEEGPAPGTTRYFFLPHEATFSTAKTTAIPMSVLSALIAKLSCNELVVIFDCCHGGGLANEVLSAFWEGPLKQDLLTGQRSVVFLAAAPGSADTYELDEGGFYLQALCKGLEGGAQADPAGRISVQSAQDYAAGVARSAAGGWGLLQSPVGAPAARPIYLTRPAHVLRAVAPFDVPFPEDDAFVGRQAELDAVHKLLASARKVGIHPTGLTGMGGVGKTALAVQYAHAYRDQYAEGVFWINAAEPLAEGFGRIGRFLRPSTARPAPGTPAHAALEEQVQAAFDELKARPESLLILDNLADPLNVDRPVTTTCVPARLPGAVLFTTRQERTGKFAAVEVNVLPEREALRLLLAHGARKAILDSSHAEHAEAARIAALLGYLPLALELAGTFLGEKKPGLSLAGYRKALEQHGCIPLLEGAVRGTSLARIHEQAVEATLSEQWSALDAADDRLLLRVAGQLPEAIAIPMERLGLLAGVSDAGEYGVLASDLEDALERLAGSSLVKRLGENRGSVRLHPLVREFARRQSPPDETADFRRACAARLSAAFDEIATLESQVAARGVDAVQEDLIAALGLCRGPADVTA
jgi:hypothetical protein